jgi:hypothetical protein
MCPPHWIGPVQLPALMVHVKREPIMTYTIDDLPVMLDGLMGAPNESSSRQDIAEATAVTTGMLPMPCRLSRGLCACSIPLLMTRAMSGNYGPAFACLANENRDHRMAGPDLESAYATALRRPKSDVRNGGRRWVDLRCIGISLRHAPR